MKTILLQAAVAGGEAGAMGAIMQYAPLIMIGLVFYFFMIRPQMKRSKEAKLFRESLATGDKVVTAGGIHGKVLEINDTTVLISSEGSTKFRIEKSSVTSSEADQLVNQKK